MALETLAKVAVESKETIGEVGKTISEFAGDKIDSDKRINPIEKTSDKEYSYDGLSSIEKIIGLAWGYPKGILDNIYNFSELKHYHDLGLIAKKFGETVDGKDRFILVPKDLDMKRVVDSQGLTNEDRAKQGKSLIKDGKILEVHHIGQKEGGHYALLTKAEHTQNGNDKILHDYSKSGVDHGNSFLSEKKEIFKTLAEGV